MNKTLEFYNNNAEDYFNKTVKVEMNDKYNKFLKYLPINSHILDLGCGSGRDSKYFKDNGYTVTAIDGSKELSDLASQYIGDKVYTINFEDIGTVLNDVKTCDGVWACASLLHLKKEEMLNVLKKMHIVLKDDGFMYLSVKIGKDYSDYENERYFTYYKKRNST